METISPDCFAVGGGPVCSVVLVVQKVKPAANATDCAKQNQLFSHSQNLVSFAFQKVGKIEDDWYPSDEGFGGFEKSVDYVKSCRPKRSFSQLNVKASGGTDKEASKTINTGMISKPKHRYI